MHKNNVKPLTISENEVYEMFAEIYYNKVYTPYKHDEIHVTETTQCLLKSFFQRKIQRLLLQPKVVVLSFGELVHRALHEPLRRRNFNVEVEGKTTIGDVTLIGHADALSKRYVLEFKTATKMPVDALQHHVLQCNAYSYIFDVDLGSIVYIHKPSGRIKIYDVPRDDKMWNYVLLRAYRLSYSLKNDVTPNPEPSWLCSYCEYVDLCPSPSPAMRKRWL